MRRPDPCGRLAELRGGRSTGGFRYQQSLLVNVRRGKQLRIPHASRRQLLQLCSDRLRPTMLSGVQCDFPSMSTRCASASASLFECDEPERPDNRLLLLRQRQEVHEPDAPAGRSVPDVGLQLGREGKLLGNWKSLLLEAGLVRCERLEDGLLRPRKDL